MDVEMIFKIAGIGVVVAVAEQLLSRAGRQDIALMVALAGLAIVMLITVSAVGEVFAAVRTLFALP